MSNKNHSTTGQLTRLDRVSNHGRVGRWSIWPSHTWYPHGIRWSYYPGVESTCYINPKTIGRNTPVSPLNPSATAVAATRYIECEFCQADSTEPPWGNPPNTSFPPLLKAVPGFVLLFRVTGPLLAVSFFFRAKQCSKNAFPKAQELDCRTLTVNWRSSCKAGTVRCPAVWLRSARVSVGSWGGAKQPMGEVTL